MIERAVLAFICLAIFVSYLAATWSQAQALTPTPSPTPTRTPVPAGTFYGDVNLDGSVNSTDAGLILQFDVRLINSMACSPCADIQQDKDIDAIDAELILQFEAGLWNY